MAEELYEELPGEAIEEDLYEDLPDSAYQAANQYPFPTPVSPSYNTGGAPPPLPSSAPPPLPSSAPPPHPSGAPPPLPTGPIPQHRPGGLSPPAHQSSAPPLPTRSATTVVTTVQTPPPKKQDKAKTATKKKAAPPPKSAKGGGGGGGLNMQEILKKARTGDRSLALEQLENKNRAKSDEDNVAPWANQLRKNSTLPRKKDEDNGAPWTKRVSQVEMEPPIVEDDTPEFLKKVRSFSRHDRQDIDVKSPPSPEPSRKPPLASKPPPSPKPGIKPVKPPPVAKPRSVPQPEGFLPKTPKNSDTSDKPDWLKQRERQVNFATGKEDENRPPPPAAKPQPITPNEINRGPSFKKPPPKPAPRKPSEVPPPIVLNPAPIEPIAQESPPSTPSVRERARTMERGAKQRVPTPPESPVPFVPPRENMPPPIPPSPSMPSKPKPGFKSQVPSPEESSHTVQKQSTPFPPPPVSAPPPSFPPPSGSSTTPPLPDRPPPTSRPPPPPSGPPITPPLPDRPPPSTRPPPPNFSMPSIPPKGPIPHPQTMGVPTPPTGEVYRRRPLRAVDAFSPPPIPPVNTKPPQYLDGYNGELGDDDEIYDDTTCVNDDFQQNGVSDGEELYDDVGQFGAPPATPSLPLPPTTPPPGPPSDVPPPLPASLPPSGRPSLATLSPSTRPSITTLSTEDPLANGVTSPSLNGEFIEPDDDQETYEDLESAAEAYTTAQSLLSPAPPTSSGLAPPSPQHSVASTGDSPTLGRKSKLTREEKKQQKEDEKKEKERKRLEKEREKERKKRDEARSKNKLKGLKQYKQYELTPEVEPLFAVEVLLEHAKTKDHLNFTQGEVARVLLLHHPKLPADKYLIEKEDGTIGYLKKNISQRTAYQSAASVLDLPPQSAVSAFQDDEDIYESLPGEEGLPGDGEYPDALQGNPGLPPPNPTRFPPPSQPAPPPPSDGPEDNYEYLPEPQLAN
ncbi:uncharacterized protein LOC135335451 isoform X2 [Halichondria panicea]|uniref:uncharacterized protein LOC135335451 isoform X2 n=1 Tax=Halichondria panicea TaxID=6063 RepID=UPI00312BB1A8